MRNALMTARHPRISDPLEEGRSWAVLQLAEGAKARVKEAGGTEAKVEEAS